MNLEAEKRKQLMKGLVEKVNKEKNDKLKKENDDKVKKEEAK